MLASISGGPQDEPRLSAVPSSESGRVVAREDRVRLDGSICCAGRSPGGIGHGAGRHRHSMQEEFDPQVRRWQQHRRGEHAHDGGQVRKECCKCRAEEEDHGRNESPGAWSKDDSEWAVTSRQLALRGANVALCLLEGVARVVHDHNLLMRSAGAYLPLCPVVPDERTSLVRVPSRHEQNGQSHEPRVTIG